jgi:hypothetical protein
MSYTTLLISMLTTSPSPLYVCDNVQKHFIFKVRLINVYVYCTVFKVHVQINLKKSEEKNISYWAD